MSADPDEPAFYMQCREVQGLRVSADSGLVTHDFNTEDQRSLGGGADGRFQGFR